MDEAVIKAMQKWPNVPDVFGWLRLDRRGNWLLKTAPGRFERIGNPALVEFINRNYGCDERGRWFFQNGPQRVFVGLDYMPYIYRLGEDSACWLTHTGAGAGCIHQLLFDETDNVVLLAEHGPGLVADRDLPALIDGLSDGTGEVDAEVLLWRLRGGAAEQDLKLFGKPVTTGVIASGAVAVRFGFVAEPQTEQEQVQP